MSSALLATVLVGAGMGVVALGVSILRPAAGVWPAPQQDEPASRVRLLVHRAVGVLIMTAGLAALALGLVDRGSLALPPVLRWLVGPALFASGGTFGIWGYAQLGVDVSHGAVAPLEVTGPYRYSRNPQYVGAVAGLLGFAVLCNSTLGLLAAAAVSVWFVVAPFAEERWLRRHVGARYDAYVESSSRYLGLPR